MKKLLISAMLLLSAAGLARAEKADTYKAMTIDFDQADVDDVKQVSTFTGNVILTRGTLLMKAAKAVLRKTPEGDQYVTLTSAPGTLATFRQKRDGAGELWVEGEAERIEYDDRVEQVKLFSRAMVRQLEGGKPKQDVAGAFISYDSRREVFTVHNTVTGESKPGGGRGTVTLQPSRQPPPPDAGKEAGK